MSALTFAAPCVETLPDRILTLALEADLFAEEHRFAALTVTTYDSHWKVFSRCLTDLGFDTALPCSQPALAGFLRWVLDRDRDRVGPGWSPSYVEGILAAVRDRHRQHGLEDPTAHPGIVALRPQMRVVLSRAATRYQTPPIALEELRQLVAACLPARTRAAAARELAVLLCLERGLTLSQLCERALTTSAGTVRLGDDVIELSCVCAGDLATGCGGCALQALRLRDHVPFGWSSIKQLRRDVSGALQRLADLEGQAAEQLPLLIRALVDPQVVHGLRMRAWTLLGWDRGLRAQDLRQLLRHELVEVDGGLRIRLRRGKNDPLGEGVDTSVLPQPKQVLCPVRAVQRWLRVRDLLGDDLHQAADGYAFCPASPTGKPLLHAMLDRNTDLAAWRRLRKAAGLPDLSQHGLRAGFIVEAHKQGHSAEAIQFTVRHQRIEQTYDYLSGLLPLDAARPSAEAVNAHE